MGYLSNSGETLKIDAKIEELILSNKKVIEKPIQLGDLKNFFNDAEYESKQKATRKNYRSEVSKFLQSSDVAKKLESGSITIAELEKVANKIETFGSLKKIVIYGIKDKGEKRNSTFLYIKAIK